MKVEKIMQKLFKVCATFLAVFLTVSACSDSKTGPSEAELTGTWVATKMEFTNRSNTSTKVDIVPLGATGTLTLENNGNFNLSATIPEQQDMDINGTWSGSGDELTLNWTNGPINNQWQFNMNLDGDRLILEGAHTEFDFDGDENTPDEPAFFSLELTRQN